LTEGGHDVPPEKVASRIPRTLKNISKTIALCDDVYLLDNSRQDNPFQRVVEIHNGIPTMKQKPLPEWAQVILKAYLD
jgi:predicted ABC-type ATPase